MCNLPESLLAQVRADLPVYEIRPERKELAIPGHMELTGRYELIEMKPGGGIRVVMSGSQAECEKGQRSREKPKSQIFHLPPDVDRTFDLYLEAMKEKGEPTTKQAVLSGLVERVLAEPNNVALVMGFLGIK